MQEYKIWQLTNYEDQLKSLSDDPRTLNYKTGLTEQLFPVYKQKTGYIVQVPYLSEHGNEESIILRSDVTYNELEKYRDTVRKFTIITEDGSVQFGDFVKTSRKFYDNQQWEIVQKRRRQNIVDLLTAQAAQFEVLGFVQTLWRTLNAELSAYISTGDDTLIEKIASYDGQWLDAPSSIPGLTLRQVIAGQLIISEPGIIGPE